MTKILESMLRRLTSNYARNPDSNIGKLCKIAADEIAELEGALDTVREWRDLNNAEGAALDRIGYNVQQWRGVADDGVYRILIKTKIARNLSDGSIDTVKSVIAMALGIDPSEVELTELYNAPVDPEPAALHLAFPATTLLEAGFSLVQFGRLVNRIIAAGVRAYVLLEGTFQFSDAYDAVETDADTGFADLGQTVGGYFGSIYDPAEDVELPI